MRCKPVLTVLWLVVVLPAAVHAADEAVPYRLVVVDDQSYAPFAFRDSEGKARGFSVDLWRLWSERTGIPIDFRLMEWSEALAAVREGRADVVSGLFRTPMREEWFDFTDPLFEFPTSIFFHLQIQGLKELGDLPGFTVGVVKDDSSEELLRSRYPAIALRAYEDMEAMALAAVAGEIKVFVADTPVALHYLAKTPGGEAFRQSVRPVLMNRQYAAVRKGRTDVLRLVDDGFRRITKEEIRGILALWGGLAVSSRIPWKEIGLGAAALTALALGIVGWNVQLRRRIRRSTRDLAERNRELETAQAVLRQSEERYRILFTESPDAFLILYDNAIIDCNRATETLLRGTRRQIIGQSPGLLSPEFQPDGRISAVEARNRMAEALRTGAQSFEWMHRRFDGTVFWVDVCISAMDLGKRNVLFASWRDVTARRQAEEERERLRAQLMQAQKMESIGRLAGGVAHDFNNMLSVILGHAEMVLARMDPADPVFPDMQEIRSAAGRSADLTRQLLAFARKQTVLPRVLDLNETVAGMLKMIRRLIGEDVELVWQPGRNLGRVKIDPSQIDQILANLCVNSRDALGSSGRILIETGSAPRDAAGPSGPGEMPPGDYIRLTVRDNGCGMDRETQAHLFEPFFTTKEPGKGTGLGLATVYGAIRQNNGYVRIESEPGQGTAFHVYLPRCEEGTDRRRTAEREAPADGGTETVLLVEDEPAILKMTRTMLERLGYTVLAASSPGEAVAIAERESREIHLLLTDVVLPSMNGRELSGRLLALRPGLRCLFVSGYAADVIARHGVLEEGVLFIQKPFSQAGLAAKVREALTRAG